jgi:hypothetical protein
VKEFEGWGNDRLDACPEGGKIPVRREFSRPPDNEKGKFFTDHNFFRGFDRKLISPMGGGGDGKTG